MATRTNKLFFIPPLICLLNKVHYFLGCILIIHDYTVSYNEAVVKWVGTGDLLYLVHIRWWTVLTANSACWCPAISWLNSLTLSGGEQWSQPRQTQQPTPHTGSQKPDVLKPDVLKPDVLKLDVLWVYRHNREAEFCSVAGRVTTYPLISLKSLEKAVIWNLLGHNLIFEKESAYIGGEKEALLDMEMNLKTVTNKAKSESEKEQEWSSEKRKSKL